MSMIAFSGAHSVDRSRLNNSLAIADCSARSGGLHKIPSRPPSPPYISQIAVNNSQFRCIGNSAVTSCLYSGIWQRVIRNRAKWARIPVYFPSSREFAAGDGFAPDCVHSHPVCSPPARRRARALFATFRGVSRGLAARSVRPTRPWWRKLALSGHSALGADFGLTLAAEQYRLAARVRTANAFVASGTSRTNDRCTPGGLSR
jgi:hypothetical protein